MGSGEGDAVATWQCLCCDAEYPVTRDEKSLDAPLAHVETCTCEDDPTTAPVDPQ